MQRSVWKWGTVALLGLLVTACADEGVGDPCIPETVPCTVDPTTKEKQCGFNNTESFIESSSVQCRSRLCIVHKLDNGTEGVTPADPAKDCGNSSRAEGCVTSDELDKSVFCTCRCGGPGKKEDFCECPSGFTCKEILSLGGDGIRGDYCVRAD